VLCQATVGVGPALDPPRLHRHDAGERGANPALHRIEENLLEPEAESFGEIGIDGVVRSARVRRLGNRPSRFKLNTNEDLRTDVLIRPND
jgi:hypothetical protein